MAPVEQGLLGLLVIHIGAIRARKVRIGSYAAKSLTVSMRLRAVYSMLLPQESPNSKSRDRTISAAWIGVLGAVVAALA
jgi:hypothetical protein